MAKNIDQILDEIRNVLKEERSELASFPDYGNLYIIFRSIASVISEQDYKLDNVYNSLFLTTASGSNLDKRALEYGLLRGSGKKATGSVLIETSRDSLKFNRILIKEGTILLNPFTNKQYITKEPANLTRTRVEVLVESLEDSEESNVESGTKLISSFNKNVDFVVGSSYNNILNQYEGDITGGEEQENDEQLKSRILDIIKVKQSSTKDALITAITQVEGVQEVLVEENIPAVGYIALYIDNNNFNVIKEVKLLADEIKPLGTIISVNAFENIAVNINLNISLIDDSNIDNRDNLIRSTITNFVFGLNKKFTRESLAGSLLNLAYINNIEIIAPTINTEITAKQKFVTGSISLQYI